MKKLPVVLSLVALLSACGERGGTSQTGEKPVADADQVRADMQASQDAAAGALQGAQQEREDADLIKGADGRVADYKRRLLPLIAGTYGGDCMGKAGKVAGAAVTVSGDGGVSVPGNPARSLMDRGSSFSVTIDPSRLRDARPGVSIVNHQQGWKLIAIASTGSEFTTTFTDGETMLACSGPGPAASGRSGGLYGALAQYFIPAAGSMECTDGKMGTSRQTIKLTDDTLTVGANSYLLDPKDANEMAVIDSEDMSLTYSRGSSKDQQVSLKLDKRGKMETVMLLSDENRNSLTCTPAPR